MPNFFITHSIEGYLKHAQYEYDEGVGAWCAWVVGLPGAYAQADTVEDVRDQLAEVIEDYILVSIYNKNPIPELQKFAKLVPYEINAD